jgi:hypothetical protein
MSPHMKFMNKIAIYHVVERMNKFNIKEYCEKRILLATIYGLVIQNLIQNNHWQSKVKIHPNQYRMAIDIVINESDQYNLGVVRHEAARKMRVGPSESVCRSRLQTTLSCCGKEPWW